MLDLVQLPVLSDNYIYLIHDRATGTTAVIDPAVAAPVLDELARRTWRLSLILCTHHHGDHVGGNLELKAATGAKVVGAAHDRARITGLDVAVTDGDRVAVGQSSAVVIDTPGHTVGHISYWFAEDRLLFCGDTVFSMGCGRLFEGSAEQMWASLSRIKALPGDARICCAHEYTAANGRFAATIDPGNPALTARLAEVAELRALGKPTVPSTLAMECETNPFLRADRPDVAAAVGLPSGGPAKVFGEIRRRKDSFR